jgi:hypothetical protein
MALEDWAFRVTGVRSEGVTLAPPPLLSCYPRNGIIGDEH